MQTPKFFTPFQQVDRFTPSQQVCRFTGSQIPWTSYYTIVASKSVRSNSDFTLNFTIHDAKCEFENEIIVRVSIEDENEAAGFKIHRDITMKSNGTEFVTIPVGELRIDHNYKLVVTGVSGIICKHEAGLELQKQAHAILIQTDKAIYKPKDCIKYRVLVVDSELKAATVNDKELSVRFTVSKSLFFFSYQSVSMISSIIIYTVLAKSLRTSKNICFSRKFPIFKKKIFYS